MRTVKSQAQLAAIGATFRKGEGLTPWLAHSRAKGSCSFLQAGALLLSTMGTNAFRRSAATVSLIILARVLIMPARVMCAALPVRN
jgi:hypothetical protein